METPKKCLIFSQKKAFLIFSETEIPKKFFIFQETELSYISGSNFPSTKNEKKKNNKKKKTLLKANKKSAPKKFLVSCDIFVVFTAVKHNIRKLPVTIFTVVKHRESPCDYLCSSKA